MAEEKPVSPTQRSLRTLGLFLVILFGPLLLLRVTCVSRREICEGAGGQYAQTPTRTGSMHVCALPDNRGCPPTYQYSRRGEGCTALGELPGVLRTDTW